MKRKTLKVIAPSRTGFTESDPTEVLRENWPIVRKIQELVRRVRIRVEKE